MSAPSTFAGRVRHRRSELGLDPAALAAKAGVSHMAVRRAEAGSDPPLSTVRRLAKGLGVSVSYLAGPEPWLNEATETETNR